MIQVLIIGVISGIGKVIILVMKVVGYDVIVVGRQFDVLVVFEVQGICVMQFDLVDLVVIDQFVGLMFDVLINNVGMMFVMLFFVQMDMVQIDWVIDLNLCLVLVVMWVVVLGMQDWGRGYVFFIGLIVGYVFFVKLVVYCVIKVVIGGFVQVLWLDLVFYGVWVIEIVVGWVEIGFYKDLLFVEVWVVMYVGNFVVQFEDVVVMVLVVLILL